MKKTIGLVALAASVAAAPAIAADYGDQSQYDAQFADPTPVDTGVDLSIRIGIGGVYKPDYEGSDDYELSPWPIVSLEYLKLPGLNEIGGRKVGFSIGPSFNFIGSRDQDQDPALIGIGDVDSAVEVGLKGTYEVNNWGAYAAIRRGFGGHEGVVGEIAAYGIWRPNERFVLRAGPDLSFASADYFDTYFSVTPSQAAASGLPAYNAGSGLKAAGLQAVAVYSWTEKVDLHFRAGYERLLDGAADSPIVTVAGSENQFSVGMGISYRVDLDLFR